MTETGKYSIRYTFYCNAARAGSGILNGVIRLSRSQRPSYHGLCVAFEQDPDGSSTRLFRHDPFLYGTWDRLNLNFGHNDFLSNIDTGVFLDKDYCARMSGIYRRSKRVPGYFNIPTCEFVERRGRSFEQLVLVAMKKTEEILPRLLAALQPVVIPVDDPDSMKGFTSFSHYPQSLKEFALAAGEYHTLKGLVSRFTEQFELPPSATIISSPVGGLPGWARRWRDRN